MNGVCGAYVFTHNGEMFMFDINCNVILQITKELYEVLLKYIDGKDCGSNDDPMIARFLDAGLLRPVQSVEEKESFVQNAYLTFAPTYKCNFRCSYCFGDFGNKYTGNPREFDETSLYGMLEYFFFRAFPNADGYRIDFVSGGEPLLGFDIIKKTVEYVENRICCNKKRVSMWLCTNGSLLTEEIVEYLSKHKISIGISLDGVKEKNDVNRKDALGKGTYEQICNGVSAVLKNKNTSKRFREIWGLCTATNENCDFISIYEHMQALGFRNVQIRLIRSKKRYDINKIINEYEKLADFLIRRFEENKIDYLRILLNDNDQFGKVLRRVMLGHVLTRRCSAGINKITICPDGSIYPCDSFVGVPQFRIGDIKEVCTEYSSVLKDNDIHTICQCSTCEVKYLCGGDCYYNALMKTGNAFMPDKEFCEIQKKIIELALVVRFKMELISKDRYEKLRLEVKLRDDYSEIYG